MIRAAPDSPRSLTTMKKSSKHVSSTAKKKLAPRAAFAVPRPPFRRLRGYAIDPSLATQLETKPVSEIVFPVPWEELQPGRPSGEYLEVIDTDPGSHCYYEPVDLDDDALLAQDGLAPSEGTPQFHQQMVYAVASLTIRNYEHALGRLTLWRPGPSTDPKNPSDDSKFVRRLRIYPHALREQNAYYTPLRIALLFGYFKASADTTGEHMSGSMVFTCLSHDIIAHETTHALLDGMNRSFLNATNPDVHAFHEAFADVVALLQHFTFPEILREQIITTRGEIDTQETLLGQLAGQFGRSTGLRGALRYAIGTIDEQGKWKPHDPKPEEYEATQEPHARGAILVAAVFDAFLSIYKQRTADLLRLATGGTGVLRPGAIHPDLAQRLANEAAKAAHHVLTMCIRAIDYCPPVDITFGEYLRAIITADNDVVVNDDLNYRVAFLQAFRRRGIYPHDVRTLSVESLLWRGPKNDELRPSPELENVLTGLMDYSAANIYTDAREDTFKLEREMRRTIHQWLEKQFKGRHGAQDAKYLGLDRTLPFEVRTARIAHRSSPDGGMFPQLLVGLLQKTTVPMNPGKPAGPKMTFEGGCTVVADLRARTIQYCVRKQLNSEGRRDCQRAFAMKGLGSLRATYFGAQADREPFAAIHRGT
jgi:hypothetical protein